MGKKCQQTTGISNLRFYFILVTVLVITSKKIAWEMYVLIILYIY